MRRAFAIRLQSGFGEPGRHARGPADGVPTTRHSRRAREGTTADERGATPVGIRFPPNTQPSIASGIYGRRPSAYAQAKNPAPSTGSFISVAARSSAAIDPRDEPGRQTG